MRKNKKQNHESGLLPFHIILAASEGNVEAIQAVLKHYEGYIRHLSTRKMYDEFGQVHYCVDETLRQRLETKLITKTLAFQPVPFESKKTMNR
ncbi:MAG: helix-turn-helix domain-containing protein [Lachnospiraceae bacterium]|nr:helix-turn-helix domain-containing protein [Lachnospiraceae bacterium]